MLAEFDIFGVFVAPISVYALIALAVTLVFRRILWKTGLLTWFWHVPLFEIAFFVCTLCLLLMYV
ncbi:DUF1656 domain-containing protein [Neokomagataea anthophila]|uniref:DUF1656 domain-containing protein n=1 Tax=Neokomagataea anthophila TaxID=2826925 RepID=A0ABS5E7D0_9PROT|nr:DUF1656 domain-containing protein [Neokomagataea anthophila]MBR0559814.1 DUF1656 domain-containing protein [Neokomagataea anthophila]